MPRIPPPLASPVFSPAIRPIEPCGCSLAVPLQPSLGRLAYFVDRKHRSALFSSQPLVQITTKGPNRNWLRTRPVSLLALHGNDSRSSPQWDSRPPRALRNDSMEERPRAFLWRGLFLSDVPAVIRHPVLFATDGITSGTDSGCLVAGSKH